MNFNYKEMIKKHDLKATQERVFMFFFSHPHDSFTVHEVFQKFRAIHPTISINSIAPRCSELKKMNLLEVTGCKIYNYENPLTKKMTKKKQDKLRLFNPNKQFELNLG